MKARLKCNGRLLDSNPAHINADPNGANDAIRSAWNRTLNFEIPIYLCTGSVSLELIKPDGSEFKQCEREVDAHVTASFTPVTNPKIRFFTLNWKDPTTEMEYSATHQDVLDEIRKLKAIWPIDESWGYGRGAEETPLVWTGQVQTNFVTGYVSWRFYDDLVGYLYAMHSLREVRSAFDGSEAYVVLFTGPFIPVESGQPMVGGAYRGGRVAAVELAYQDSAWTTVAHELGHAVGCLCETANRSCGSKLCGTCGESFDPESSQCPPCTTFPFYFDLGYPDLSPVLGPMTDGDASLVYGLDSTFERRGIEVVSPYRSAELMGYCPPFPNWISKPTYTTIFGNLSSASAALNRSGFDEVREYFIVRGSIDVSTDAVALFPFMKISTATTLNSPAAGQYILQLLDGFGGLVNQIPFSPVFAHLERSTEPNSYGTFLIPVLANPAIRKVVVLHNGVEIASRTSSANPPQVSVTNPNGGETLVGTSTTVQWSASDPDNDQLRYTLSYSADGGDTWNILAMDLTTPQYQVSTELLKPTQQGLFKVIVSDGFNTAKDRSEAVFTVPARPPLVEIIRPTEGQIYGGNQPLTLEAEISDSVDGALPDTSITWASHADGVIGQGNPLYLVGTNLSAGPHIVTVTAMNSAGLTATASVHLVVLSETPATNTDLAINASTLATTVSAGSNLTYNIAVLNRGPDDATGVVVTNSLSLNATLVGATVPSTVWGSSIINQIGNLPAGSNRNVQVTLMPTLAGDLTNVLTITGNQLDCIPINNRASVVTAVAPSASFTATPPGGYAPLLVTFTDTSIGPITSRFWNFGDGATLNTAATNLTHTYTLPGTYNPLLIIIGPHGASTNTQTLTVNALPPPPTADFSGAPTTGVAPLTVLFTDASTGTITNRFWSFGDGPTSNTTATSIQHTYATAGTYTPALNVTGPGGSDTKALSNPIVVTPCLVTITTSNAPPAGGASTGGTVSCDSNITVTATANAGYTFVNWTEGAAVVSTATNYTFTATTNRTLVAHFAGLTIATTSPLPTGTVGIVYSNFFRATGGFPAYQWTLVTGRLPAGLKLTTSGLLAGKPTTTGTNTFRLRVTDANRQTAEEDFTLVVRDIFGPLAGTYNGLVLPTTTPAFTNSGAIKLVLSKTGSYAANLSRGGVTSTFKGQFDDAGNATNTGPTILHLDTTGQITGTVGTATLVANRAVFSGSHPCPWAGKYNCLLEPTTNLVSVPQGDGYATFTVVTGGNGALAGTLADGTALSLTVPVSAHGTWPLYKLLYANKGAVIGWVSFTPSNTVTAVVDWFKPAAFNAVLALTGTKLTPPVGVGTWQLTLADGDLLSSIVATVTINTAGTVTLPATNTYRLSLRVTPTTGKFTGSFVHPASKKTTPFTGLFLQAPESDAGGFFLGPNTSGAVTLEP